MITDTKLDYTPGELDRTAPERIWLQIDTDDISGDRSEPWNESCTAHATWCAEPVGGLEIQYLRADLARQEAVAHPTFHARFAEMLVGILADIQNELGFSDEDVECSNGSVEIVAAIRELKQQAASPAAQAVDLEPLRRMVKDWCDRATQHLDSADPDDEDDLRLYRLMAGAVGGCAGELRRFIDQQADHFRDATEMVAAQAVDLEQFRDAVVAACNWARIAYDSSDESRFLGLLQLIDQQAGKGVSHGK